MRLSLLIITLSLCYSSYPQKLIRYNDTSAYTIMLTHVYRLYSKDNGIDKSTSLTEGTTLPYVASVRFGKRSFGIAVFDTTNNQKVWQMYTILKKSPNYFKLTKATAEQEVYTLDNSDATMEDIIEVTISKQKSFSGKEYISAAVRIRIASKDNSNTGTIFLGVN
jgi:hypothetical protein